jgi:multidrug efflux pump subunit AcrA (membrane-fusion protein)
VKPRSFVVFVLMALAGAGLALAVALFFPQWLDPVRGWLRLETAELKPPQAAKPPEPEEEGAHVHLKVTEQIEQTMRLKKAKLKKLDEYLVTVPVPAQVVERPAAGDRLVSAPLAGVVKQIHAAPLDRVKPGEPLFTLQIVSEALLSAQTGYYKTRRELDLTTVQFKQVEELAKEGAVPKARVVELDQQVQRLATALETGEHELKMRGLKPAQIAAVAKGDFVTEVTVNAPGKDADPGFEVEELKVTLGEVVQAGQTVCRLADHNALYLECRVFAAEAALVHKAVGQGWKVSAEFDQGDGGDWPALAEGLEPRFFGNKVDAETQTVVFYIHLPNQFVEHGSPGKTYRQWRFRPGQRATVLVPVRKLTDVLVVPAEAVAREGPEAFVFRKCHGDEWDRIGVTVLHEDARVAVLKLDEQLTNPRRPVALNRAAQLNWMLRAAKGGEEGGHDHHHHDH